MLAIEVDYTGPGMPGPASFPSTFPVPLSVMTEIVRARVVMFFLPLTPDPLYTQSGARTQSRPCDVPGSRAEITAPHTLTQHLAAANTASTFSMLIPPIATTGIEVQPQAWVNISVCTAATPGLLGVEKTGPIAI